MNKELGQRDMERFGECHSRFAGHEDSADEIQKAYNRDVDRNCCDRKTKRYLDEITAARLACKWACVLVMFLAPSNATNKFKEMHARLERYTEELSDVFRQTLAEAENGSVGSWPAKSNKVKAKLADVREEVVNFAAEEMKNPQWLSTGKVLSVGHGERFTACFQNRSAFGALTVTPHKKSVQWTEQNQSLRTKINQTKNPKIDKLAALVLKVVKINGSSAFLKCADLDTLNVLRLRKLEWNADKCHFKFAPAEEWELPQRPDQRAGGPLFITEIVSLILNHLPTPDIGRFNAVSTYHHANSNHLLDKYVPFYLCLDNDPLVATSNVRFRYVLGEGSEKIRENEVCAVRIAGRKMKANEGIRIAVGDGAEVFGVEELCWMAGDRLYLLNESMMVEHERLDGRFRLCNLTMTWTLWNEIRVQLRTGVPGDLTMDNKDACRMLTKTHRAFLNAHFPGWDRNRNRIMNALEWASMAPRDIDFDGLGFRVPGIRPKDESGKLWKMVQAITDRDVRLRAQSLVHIIEESRKINTPAPEDEQAVWEKYFDEIKPFAEKYGPRAETLYKELWGLDLPIPRNPAYAVIQRAIDVHGRMDVLGATYLSTIQTLQERYDRIRLAFDI
ncbi:hypothetical protein HK104_002833 [Borealophlyctis nickersoniae]|nr:hypothetical protein HK104_002833 [Borealophlyctis nickersoniae]